MATGVRSGDGLARIYPLDPSEASALCSCPLPHTACRVRFKFLLFYLFSASLGCWAPSSVD
jgi:hypothetical protein